MLIFSLNNGLIHASQVIFQGSSIFSIFLSANSLFILIFSIIENLRLIKSDIFSKLKFLPIKFKLMGKITWKLIFRMNWLPLLSNYMLTPIILLLISRNFFLFLATIFISITCIMITFIVLIFSTWFLFRVKKFPLNKKIVLLLLITTTISIFLLLLPMSINNFIGTNNFTSISRLIPFPWTLSLFFITNIISPQENEFLIHMIILLVGSIVFFFVFKKIGTTKIGRAILTNELQISVRKGIEPRDIQIKSISPINAIIKRTITILSKDSLGRIYFFMPIIILLIISMAFFIPYSYAPEIAFLWSLLFTGYLPFFMNHAFSFAQQKIQPILEYLPYNKDILLRSKQQLSYLLSTRFIVIIGSFIIINSENLVNSIILQIFLIPFTFSNILVLLIIHELFLNKVGKGRYFISLVLIFNVVGGSYYSITNILDFFDGIFLISMNIFFMVVSLYIFLELTLLIIIRRKK